MPFDNLMGSGMVRQARKNELKGAQKKLHAAERELSKARPRDQGVAIAALGRAVEARDATLRLYEETNNAAELSRLEEELRGLEQKIREITQSIRMRDQPMPPVSPVQLSVGRPRQIVR